MKCEFTILKIDRPAKFRLPPVFSFLSFPFIPPTGQQIRFSNTFNNKHNPCNEHNSRNKQTDKGARIQVLDLPGIIEGAAEGKGRGRQVISTARTCNLILIVLDSAKPLTHKKIIEQELFSFGIRINQVPPNVKIVKKESGGIGYQEMVPQTKGMNSEVCRMVLKEFKVSCAEVILREDITVDQFIDVIEGNRAYIPVLYVFNKIDALTIEELDILDQMPNYVPISSQHQWNLEELMEEIWDRCNMLRIYTKPKGQIPDYDEPVILHSERNPTVEEFCNRIHRTLIDQ